MQIGKRNALRKYYPFAINTGCFFYSDICMPTYSTNFEFSALFFQFKIR